MPRSSRGPKRLHGGFAPEGDIGSAPMTRPFRSKRDLLSTHLRAAVAADDAMVASSRKLPRTSPPIADGGTAVITCAASGIGPVAPWRFADLGLSVVLADQSGEKYRSEAQTAFRAMPPKRRLAIPGSDPKTELGGLFQSRPVSSVGLTIQVPVPLATRQN